jgi:hypothetical protein
MSAPPHVQRYRSPDGQEVIAFHGMIEVPDGTNPLKAMIQYSQQHGFLPVCDDHKRLVNRMRELGLVDRVDLDCWLTDKFGQGLPDAISLTSLLERLEPYPRVEDLRQITAAVEREVARFLQTTQPALSGLQASQDTAAALGPPVSTPPAPMGAAKSPDPAAPPAPAGPGQQHADEPHPDGPEGGRWVWWKNERHMVPKGTVYRLLEYMWRRNSASYDQLVDEEVFESEVAPQTIRSYANKVNNALPPGFLWRLSADAVGRQLTKVPAAEGS